MVRRLAGRRGHNTGLFLVSLLAALAGVEAGSRDVVPAPTGQVPWATGVPVPIEVREGRATFQVPATPEGRDLLVVVSSLGRSSGKFPMRLEAGICVGGAVPELARPEAPGIARQEEGLEHAVPPLPERMPPRERTFHLMVREGDVTSASNYLAVRGMLRAVGRRIQVYVGAEDVDSVDEATLRDMVATFDEHIFPVSARLFGPASDVDGDGRFTVLLSSWLTRMGGGHNSVDGYVRVADLDPIYSPPFGNRCDMMYLSTRLKAGPYLRTIMVHEYTHAVTFSRKSIDPPVPTRGPFEEEGWLDEALSHLVEDLHGFSSANLDYRISAFLTRPERYGLIVEDYYAADLFRSHGNRGSTYLFLRWCADRCGPGLITSMIRSRLRGLPNLESAAGARFAELYRRWSLALFTSGLFPGETGASGTIPGFRSAQLRMPMGEWVLAGPRTVGVTVGGPSDRWIATGTSSHFALVHSKGAGPVEVRMVAPPESQPQVTVIPLPPDMARLEVSARTFSGPDGGLRLRASIREKNGTRVRLSAMAWEPVPLPASPTLSPRCGGLDMPGIVDAFGSSSVSPGGEVLARQIVLNGFRRESGTLAIKVIGTDDKGHRVAAWADVNLDTGDERDEVEGLAAQVHSPGSTDVP